MRGCVKTDYLAVWKYLMTFIVCQTGLSLTFISTEGTQPGAICFDELLIQPCEDLNRMDKTILDVEWKAKNSKDNHWILFGYCNRFLTCAVLQPTLPNGVKVTNISNGNVTLQFSAKNMTDGITELKCLVTYLDSTINTPLVIKIHYSNFTVCIRDQKASDVNFTRVLQNILPWQQVADMEFYDSNKRKLAYCHTSNCTKETIDGSDAAPVFWNRLQVKQGSLLLTSILESDDEREFRVKVHLTDDSVLAYSLKILVVNGSQGTEIMPLTTATASPTAPRTAIPLVTATTTPTESSSMPPSRHPETQTNGSIRGLSSMSAVPGREWTAVLIAVDAFIGIVLGD